MGVSPYSVGFGAGAVCRTPYCLPFFVMGAVPEGSSPFGSLYHIGHTFVKYFEKNCSYIKKRLTFASRLMRFTFSQAPLP